MNKKLLFFSTALLAASLNVTAQTNAVEVKDASNLVIGQYNSISSAYSALSTPLSQSYTIELTSIYDASSETYPINLTALSGASASNTVTIRPAAGVSSITISNASSGASVLQLNDADYVTIDGRAGGIGTTPALTFTNTSTNSNSNTITLINGACFNKTRYCNINNATTTGTGRTYALSTSASNTSGNSDNVLEYCILNGSRYGINTSGTAANPNSRNTIYGCSIVNMVFSGIWYQAGSAKLTIDSNQFYCTTPSISAGYAILFDSQADTVIISRNKIYDINAGTTTGLAKGITFRSVLTNNYSLIYNNMIALSSANVGASPVYALEYATSAGNVFADIYYNTISVQGTLTSASTRLSAALFRSGTGASSVFNVYNNIFVNERSGGAAASTHFAANISSTTGTINSGYNTYYSATGNHINVVSTVYTNLSAYQTAVPSDVNSNFNSVQFVGTTDLHLTGSSIGDASLNAIPVAAPLIATDFDGELRGAIPYRGADESVIAPLPLELLRFDAAWVGSNVQLNWRTANEKNHKEFVIERSYNATDFTVVKTVAARGNDIPDETNYDIIDNEVSRSAKSVYYRLKITDLANKSYYSHIVQLQKNIPNDFAEMQVIPNPFTSDIVIRIQAKQAGKVGILLTDLSGKNVVSDTRTLVDGENNLHLYNLGNVPSGIYLLKVRSEDREQTFRLVK